VEVSRPDRHRERFHGQHIRVGRRAGECDHPRIPSKLYRLGLRANLLRKSSIFLDTKSSTTSLQNSTSGSLALLIADNETFRRSGNPFCKYSKVLPKSSVTIGGNVEELRRDLLFRSKVSAAAFRRMLRNLHKELP